MSSAFASQIPALPARKRRRPALSCLECRRRKIKCDRNSPCGPCTHSKSSTCTYSAANDPATKNGYESSVAASNTSNSDMRIETSCQTPNPRPFRPSSRITPVISPRLPFDDVRSNQFDETSPPWTRPQPGDSPSVETGEDLISRVQKLEKLVLDSSKPKEASEINFQDEFVTEKMKGALSKTRFFGQSHWITSFDHFETIIKLKKRLRDNNPPGSQISEVVSMLHKCKKISRASKAATGRAEINVTHIGQLIPSRQVSNQLLDCYLRTFESAYRILHIPTFQKEYAKYWDDPQSASPGFIIKLLLVLALGTIFYNNPADEAALRSLASGWIHAAQSWLLAPFEKGRLNLSGLQTFCLLLLARHTNGEGGDLVWISAGSLLRTAMQMGFHRDPRNFPKMLVLQAEIRRRLWATILELTVQMSLDSGMPPLLSFHDFDTESPSNIDDNEMDETTEIAPPSKPLTIVTQTSFQIILLQSLRTRLKICNILNDFRNRSPYDDVLRLSSQMTRFCREAVSLVQSYSTSYPGILTAFHRNYLDLLLRRFLLTLHRPYANYARVDPRYYFSRKVSIECALATISPEKDNDFDRFITIGRGMFRGATMVAAITICLELMMQVEEESSTPAVLLRTRTCREPLMQAVREMIDLFHRRLTYADNNVKGHVFLCAAYAQIEAMERGENVEDAITTAVLKSVHECYDALEARLGDNTVITPPSTVTTDQSLSTSTSTDFRMSVDQNYIGFDFEQASAEFEMVDSWPFSEWNDNSWQ